MAPFLPQIQSFTQFFAFPDKFIVKRAGIQPRQFESPFAGDGFGGKTLAAALYSGNQNPFRRN
jgi:hypothetical protein